MRLYLFIILIALSSLSFITTNDKPFEGVVSFKLEYPNIDTRFPKDYICSLRGDSMVYYHNDNGYVKQYYYLHKKIQSRWFDRKENSLNMNYEIDDSLYYYFADETDFNAKIEETEITENILGHNCRKFTVTLTPKKGKNFPEVKYDYFIALDIKINLEPYKNFIEGGYFELLKKNPGLVLKQVYYDTYYTQTKVATQVLRKKVNLEPHKPSKQLIKKKI